jgi:hypothetical protein
MERRTAVTTSAATVAVLLTGGVAIAANLGILNRQDSSLGNLSPIAATGSPASTTHATSPPAPGVETLYVDEYVQANSGTGGITPSLRPPATAGPTPSNAIDEPARSVVPDQSSGDDSEDHDEYEDGHDGDHEDEAEDGEHKEEHEEEEEHEYEGGEDDD